MQEIVKSGPICMWYTFFILIFWETRRPQEVDKMVHFLRLVLALVCQTPTNQPEKEGQNLQGKERKTLKSEYRQD